MVHTGNRSGQRNENVPPASRGARIQKLANRSYTDEQGICLSNGLSTELICFPSDRLLTKRAYLGEKIHHAIHYATRFADVEALNALHCVPETGEKFLSDYLAIGLYLYFADECSRLAKEKTFLTAMREAGAELKPGGDAAAEELYKKCLFALENLGMADSHKAVITEWHERGSYTVENVKHASDEIGLTGAYAQLARNICLQQKYLGMNMPISYALGNREALMGMTSYEAYKFTVSMAKEDSRDRMVSVIERGDKTREARIRNIIHKDVPLPGDRRDNLILKTAYNYVPDNVFELLERQGYGVAYADADNISSVFPRGGLPENTDAENMQTRSCKGLLLSRFRLIFISNGKRVVADDVKKDDALHAQVLAQTLLHETMHLMMETLSQNEREPLFAAISSLSTKLKESGDCLPSSFGRPLRTIDTNSLAEVCDYTSRLYKPYYREGAVAYSRCCEEVACNLFALTHTEFAAAQVSPFCPAPLALPGLAEVTAHLQTIMKTALARTPQKAGAILPTLGR